MAREKISFRRLLDVSYESDQRLDRVGNVILSTDTGVHKVRGTTFRRLFNLPSTTFAVGDRSSIGRTIASAVDITPVRQRKATTGIMLASLGNTTDGPAQLFLMTSQGLARVVKPENGWKTIAWGKRTASEAPQTAPEPRQISLSENSDIEIFGRGFGHQVGLCQAGAIEMGKRNWSYRQILAFYYSNAALRSLGY